MWYGLGLSLSLSEKTEKLTTFCTDDILQRISPYLRRNSPIDILDLWPGSGFWSSKVNDFLQPRRHVLIEPDMTAYGPLLRPIAASKPCYEILERDVYSIDDWADIIKQYLPEQGPSNRNTAGVLPKNDTLLVLANPPETVSKKDHYTPARWWSVLMEDCMKQSGLHCYGSVPMLVSLPVSEVQVVLPRSVANRRRPAVLTECLARHAVEVANPYAYELEAWYTWKGWDLISKSTKRVAERTAEQNIVVPAGREPPPLLTAPESPDPGLKPTPYMPRLRTERHERQIKELKAADRTPKSATSKRQRGRISTKLNQENRSVYIRDLITRNQLKIDLLSQTLSAAAADPASNSERLKALDGQLAALKSAAAEQIANTHFTARGMADLTTDDSRTALLSSNFDDSVLLWDQRPFEPLHIKSEEVYPRELPRSLLYFEADPKSPVMQKLQPVPVEERRELLQLFEASSLSFATSNGKPVGEILQSIFPGRSINDLVKAIPSLAPYATKRIKPNAGPTPLKGPTDPNRCFQENVDYDMSDCRLRCLPVLTLWEILLEYQKNSMNYVSALQFSRLLGGTMTSYRAGIYLGDTSVKLR